jgi:hypothetical protein
MKWGAIVALALAIVFATSSVALSQRGKRARSTRPTVSLAANPQPHNQFVTVEEFIRSKRAPRMAVSVEGYIVVGYRLPNGSLRLSLTDSVDKVLSAEDANALMRTGATCVVPASEVKKSARRGWTQQGMQRFVLYTGPGMAKTALHDVVEKMRLTGWTAKGRATIDPVTNIEYMDENGEWRSLGPSSKQLSRK